MKRTLVVGRGSVTGSLPTSSGDLSATPSWVCTMSLDDEAPASTPVLGAIADVPRVVVDHAIDIVIVAGATLRGRLRRLSWALDGAGAQLIVAPDLVEVHAPRLTLRPGRAESLLEVEVGSPPGGCSRRRRLGRASTVSSSRSPPPAARAFAVRVSSPGPATPPDAHRGRRRGCAPRCAACVDADERRRALLAQNEGDGVLFKMKKDPRVTPVGRFLRRFSIDELPQLVNVVRGDMSLVGPRPPLGEEVAVYADAVHRRLRVKPGLTGLWQVSGRSDLSWEESVRLDLRYVDNWSVAMDLLILWKTCEPWSDLGCVLNFCPFASGGRCTTTRPERPVGRHERAGRRSESRTAQRRPARQHQVDPARPSPGGSTRACAVCCAAAPGDDDRRVGVDVGPSRAPARAGAAPLARAAFFPPVAARPR